MKLSGILDIPSGKTQHEDSDTDPTQLKLPFELISLKSFDLKDVRINNRLILPEGELILHSNLGIELENIELTGPHLDINDLADIKGKVSISGSDCDIFGHALDLEELLLDISEQKFVIKELTITRDSNNHDNKKIAVNDLRLVLFEVDGLNYYSLLKEEHLQFRKLTINDLMADIILDKQNVIKDDSLG